MTIPSLRASGTAAQCGALVIALAMTGHAAAQSDSTFRSGELLAMDPIELARLLDESRPTPVPPAERTQALAALPEQGLVHSLDAEARRKLAALAPVLEVAQRASVYAIRVIDVPQPFVGLHGRSVVLISLAALRLMTEGELRALVAHETGHEYVQPEYERAMAAGRSGRLQDLELVCDIIGVMNLHAIGQKGSSLVAGIEKLLRFDRFHFGGTDHPDYPAPLLRRSTILALEQRLSRGTRRQ